MQERILEHLCNNMREQDNEDESTNTSDNTKVKVNITERDVERCINMREMLLEKIDVLGRKLPPNTLDKLISELGGTNLVAEMTGRRGRVVRTEYDGYKYEPRCENDSTMDLVNYREKQRFMDGSKHVAIISEAASVEYLYRVTRGFPISGAVCTSLWNSHGVQIGPYSNLGALIAPIRSMHRNMYL